MIDIVVFSHSCLRRINRLVYEDISKISDFNFHLVVPKSIFSGNHEIIADNQNIKDKCKVYYLNLLGSNPKNFWFEGSIEFLDKIKPKIIHIDNDPLSYQVRKLAVWARKNEIKTSTLSCENLSYYPIDNFKRLGFKGLLRSLYKLSLIEITKNKIDNVFTINSEGEKLFSSYGFKNVNKIPLGFSSDIFFFDEVTREKKRKELGINNMLVFAYIGRLVKEKGVHILLKALSKLRDNENWVLLIDEFKDSKSTYQKEITSLIDDLKINKKIKYFDANHYEISKFMNASDVVVVPSLSSPKWVEQYGRVVPEAMACGKLVVASKSGTLIHLVSDAGILFEEGNVDELTNICNTLINNKEDLIKYKDKAIKRSKKLDTLSQAKEMISVFQNLLT